MWGRAKGEKELVELISSIIVITNGIVLKKTEGFECRAFLYMHGYETQNVL